MAKKKIGTIVNTYGLKGQIKISSTTTNPDKRFAVGKKIIIKNKLNKDETYTITSVIVKNPKIYYVGLEGFKDINEVEWMIGRDVTAEVRATKGTFFFDDLVGLTVIDAKGNEVGKVDTITQMPAGDYLVVGKHYIPFKQDLFIKNVDIAEKKVYLTDLATETLD